VLLLFEMSKIKCTPYTYKNTEGNYNYKCGCDCVCKSHSVLSRVSLRKYVVYVTEFHSAGALASLHLTCNAALCFVKM
jgi:hypothetical protein